MMVFRKWKVSLSPTLMYIFVRSCTLISFEVNVYLFTNVYGLAGLHKLWYPVVRDRSTWSKFGAHGEHGDVFLFSNLGVL